MNTLIVLALSVSEKTTTATHIPSTPILARGTVIAALEVEQASTACDFISVQQEGRIMIKATSTLIAAVAALALSGGAYAQAAGGANGGGTSGSTASPANQANQPNGTTSGYGTPGMTNSDSGMAAKAPNSGLPSGTNGDASTPAPKTNNTLATPSVVSPAGH